MTQDELNKTEIRLAELERQLDERSKDIQNKKIAIVKEYELLSNSKKDVDLLKARFEEELSKYNILIEQSKLSIAKRDNELIDLSAKKDEYIKLYTDISKEKEAFIKEKESLKVELTQIENLKDALNSKEKELLDKSKYLDKKENELTLKEKNILKLQEDVANKEIENKNKIDDIISREKNIELREKSIKYREMQVNKAIKDKNLQTMIG